jgi:general secretion pathway protein G
MLVVLAILVLLVSMVAPRVLKSQKKADMQTAETQIGTLQKCLKFYALDMKDYPSTEDGLTALLKAPEGEGETSSTKWDGPYIDRDEIPVDPWGNEYQYEYPATRGSGPDPDIWSYGPDGEDDTEDDICSWSGSGGEGGEEGDFDDSEPELDLEG